MVVLRLATDSRTHRIFISGNLFNKYLKVKSHVHTFYLADVYYSQNGSRTLTKHFW